MQGFWVKKPRLILGYIRYLKLEKSSDSFAEILIRNVDRRQQTAQTWTRTRTNCLRRLPKSEVRMFISQYNLMIQSSIVSIHQIVFHESKCTQSSEA